MVIVGGPADSVAGLTPHQRQTVNTQLTEVQGLCYQLLFAVSALSPQFVISHHHCFPADCFPQPANRLPWPCLGWCWQTLTPVTSAVSRGQIGGQSASHEWLSRLVAQRKG